MRKFNLSLDDFSPHPKAGLGFESIKWCKELIKDYPDIKINLFVPAAYCRLNERPQFLCSHPNWVSDVNRLPVRNFRINMHGLFHRRVDNKHPDSNNDEFQFLRGTWVNTVIDRMMKEFDESGLKYQKTFRPPGWKISLSSARELTERGFIIAGNDAYYDLLKDRIDCLEWVSYNWDMTGPCDVDGDVIAYGHTSNWTNNYMNEERYNLVRELLKSDNFDFRFIEDREIRK